MANKWELIGKVKSSDWRFRVLLALKESVKTPSELSKEVKISYSHISDLLNELGEMKLIACKTPNLRKGKIYAITKLGKDVLKEI